jgi:N-acetyl-beta-hexosaminidase
MHISLKAMVNNTIKKEGYSIEINSMGIDIQYGDYSGYVYALETLSQIFKEGKLRHCSIRDEPLL